MTAVFSIFDSFKKINYFNAHAKLLQSTIYIILSLVFLTFILKKIPWELSDSTIYNGVLKSRGLVLEFLYQRLIKMSFPEDENHLTKLYNFEQFFIVQY